MRLLLNVRWLLILIVTIALALAICLPYTNAGMVRTASGMVKKEYPGIDLSEYNVRVGGPGFFHRCVVFRHKDGKSGMNVFIFVDPGVRVHSDGPAPGVRPTPQALQRRPHRPDAHSAIITLLSGAGPLSYVVSRLGRNHQL